MDSQLQRDGRLLQLVDKQWREDMKQLPSEDIAVPVMQLPDPEPDNGNPNETLKDLELKWTDLALNRITSRDNNNNNSHANGN
ncbi:anaphase-promoting complex subunit 13-like [Oppia nitens]|uniref:anaphase-promoting complex subunit 13-like n=1 Tax=Oppia nitens TaxID=1686743 RepID=UPI0023DBEE7D|nr:anaphase-promoting complex subunit 13-like [Oppia nitens]